MDHVNPQSRLITVSTPVHCQRRWHTAAEEKPKEKKQPKLKYYFQKQVR